MLEEGGRSHNTFFFRNGHLLGVGAVINHSNFVIELVHGTKDVQRNN